MVRDLGGPEVSAFGFAIGLERLLIASKIESSTRVIDAVVVPLGRAAESPALVLGRALRNAGVRCEIDTRGTSLKSQLRRATSLGARFALILGDSEMAEGVVQVKNMDAHSQVRLAPDEAVQTVAANVRSITDDSPHATWVESKEAP
jgi:histidyl-tRNA synthetase